jgi:hypothetical protein
MNPTGLNALHRSRRVVVRTGVKPRRLPGRGDRGQGPPRRPVRRPEADRQHRLARRRAPPRRGTGVLCHLAQRLRRAPVLSEPGQRGRIVGAKAQHRSRHRHQGMEVERAGARLVPTRATASACRRATAVINRSATMRARCRLRLRAGACKDRRAAAARRADGNNPPPCGRGRAARGRSRRRRRRPGTAPAPPWARWRAAGDAASRCARGAAGQVRLNRAMDPAPVPTGPMPVRSPLGCPAPGHL